MSKRRNHDSSFKAPVALEAVKGERAVPEFGDAYQDHPTIIHRKRHQRRFLRFNGERENAAVKVTCSPRRPNPRLQESP